MQGTNFVGGPSAAPAAAPAAPATSSPASASGGASSVFAPQAAAPAPGAPNGDVVAKKQELPSNQVGRIVGQDGKVRRVAWVGVH